MSQRDIIEIDEDVCNGCGQCVDACKEGAIQLVNGKAKLIRDDYCDGLGACLGECPVGAITITQREAASFDEEAVAAHMQTASKDAQPAPAPATIEKPATLPCGCPGTHERTFSAKAACHASDAGTGSQPSMLTHWPIQLKLINPESAAFHEADLLIAADCTAFALGAFHQKLLRNRSVVIACPKLDTHDGYVEKLTALFRNHAPRSITVARMEVPCCAGLTRLVREAHAQAECPVPIREVIISAEGEMQG